MKIGKTTSYHAKVFQMCYLKTAFHFPSNCSLRVSMPYANILFDPVIMRRKTPFLPAGNQSLFILVN